ncbi:MAG: MerR family transcriptional regulator [Sphingomonas bacterium]|jgi:DNA-binding transcriptional MerR regulator|uniref:MerR family transcriptional regulator n=1 Tax=Sphingomonas bacterium TaxID=1895847 RepID=UPI00260791F3|nr:MerR family transcriptional regulator [Sphingomonas bacterium]MDB5709374.1 MerR family transcriptional regulator [Sphingomonas bacterium]
MAAASDKAAGAFRTIGELSRETGLPQHILRYWETRFPQLRPLQRAGNRRYYRPEDVALVMRINAMLNQEGYTIRGVQKLLSSERKRAMPAVDLGALQAVRDQLARSLAEDAA